jgi:hypothetical protein
MNHSTYINSKQHLSYYLVIKQVGFIALLAPTVVTLFRALLCILLAYTCTSDSLSAVQLRNCTVWAVHICYLFSLSDFKHFLRLVVRQF